MRRYLPYNFFPASSYLSPATQVGFPSISATNRPIRVRDWQNLAR